MNDQIKFGLAGLLIGGVVVWSFTTSQNPSYSGMMGSKTTSQTTQQNTDRIDAHFIEQMIPHHEDAVTMAKLALTKAKRPEVKELATNIIDSQGKEIAQMKEWYKKWFGKDVPAGTQVMNKHGMMENRGSTHMGVMGDATDMAKLEAAADFDTAFVEEMIPHHQMALMMTNMLKNGTDRAEMKRLAEDIIMAQTKEIDLMRGWLKSWEK